MIVKVRAAVEQDLPTIVDFNIAMARESENFILEPTIANQGVEILFHSPNKGCYYVVEPLTPNETTILASFLITYEWSDWRAKEIWWLQSLYVLPDYRRKGVFTQVYEQIKKLAQAKGSPFLRLYVDAQNHNAIKQYIRVGMNNNHYLLFEQALTN